MSSRLTLEHLDLPSSATNRKGPWVKLDQNKNYKKDRETTQLIDLSA